MSTKLVKLDDAAVGEVQKELRNLADLIPEIDQMEACGIDCSGARVVRDRLFDNLTQLLANFSDYRAAQPTVPRG